MKNYFNRLFEKLFKDIGYREESPGIWIKENNDLRDYFASIAMKVLCEQLLSRAGENPSASHIAKHSYRMADAMLKQRNKK